MKEAYLYDSLEGQKTKCRLCYKQCVIAPGESGFCKVRSNKDGKLYADNYGISTHFVRDTIETEGVFHYRPGCATIEMGHTDVIFTANSVRTGNTLKLTKQISKPS